MSRVQTKPSTVSDTRRSKQRLDGLERVNNTYRLRDFSTTGLSSAQIDTLVFGSGQQTFDGAQVTDSARSIILVRLGGKWGFAALSIIP